MGFLSFNKRVSDREAEQMRWRRTDYKLLSAHKHTHAQHARCRWAGKSVRHWGTYRSLHRFLQQKNDLEWIWQMVSCIWGIKHAEYAYVWLCKCTRCIIRALAVIGKHKITTKEFPLAIGKFSVWYFSEHLRYGEQIYVLRGIKVKIKSRRGGWQISEPNRGREKWVLIKLK